MSMDNTNIRLAEGEKVIRNYDYTQSSSLGITSSTRSARNLMVTNKRVIHTTTKGGMGKEQLSVQELPIKYIRTVNSFYGKKKYPAFLFLGIVFALIGLFLTIMINEPALLIFLIPAAIFALIYVFKTDYSYSCNISANGIVCNGMSLGSSSGNSLTRGLFKSAAALDVTTTINIQVKVNGDITKQMVSELGSVIMDVKNGVYDN